MLRFFDVDHTITRGSTGRRFAEAAARARILKPRYLAMIPINYLQYRLGSGGLEYFQGDFPFLQGLPRERFEELGREVFERKTRDSIRPQMVKLISRLRAEGCRIVLATSSLDFIVGPIADYLGVDEVLASRLGFEGGLCTGRLDGKVLFGEAKRDAVLAYARERQFEASSCAFYSDSIHDLPLLLEVGQPVAVNPDRRLRSEARARAWEILDF